MRAGDLTEPGGDDGMESPSMAFMIGTFEWTHNAAASSATDGIGMWGVVAPGRLAHIAGCDSGS